MAFLFTAQSLVSIRACCDAVQVLEDALKRFPSRQYLSKLLLQAKADMELKKDNNRP